MGDGGRGLPKGANDCRTFLMEKILPAKEREVQIELSSRRSSHVIINLPKSEAGTMFETMVRHMGPAMERKKPKTTERYMCQGSVEKPRAK